MATNPNRLGFLQMPTTFLVVLFVLVVMAMAHIEKIKVHGVGQLVAHNRRLREVGRYSNENIDPERTPLNYRIGGVPDVTAALSKAARETPRGKLRKNQVALFTIANTLPRDWPDGRDAREYFELCHEFNVGLFPTATSVGMDVHMDETTPHGHDGFFPTTEDKRFNFDEVVPRRKYQSYHKELQKFLEERTGMRLQVLLDRDDPDKLLSSLPQGKLDEARAAVKRDLEEIRDVAAIEANEAARKANEAARRRDELETEVAEASGRLERLRRDEAELEEEVEELKPIARTLSESRAIIAEGRGVDERVEGLEREVESARERLERLEDEKADAERQCEQYTRQIDSDEDEIRRVERSIGGIVESIWSLAAVWVERGNKLICDISERAAHVLLLFGVNAMSGHYEELEPLTRARSARVDQDRSR